MLTARLPHQLPFAIYAPAHGLRLSLTHAVLATVIALLLLTTACQSDQPEPALEPTIPGGVDLSAPEEVLAGTAVQVRLRTGLPVTTDAFVTIESSNGFVPRTVAVEDGRAVIELPAESMSRVGLVTVTARIGDEQADSEIIVLPGPPVDPILPLVGPRSIIADGSHWTMVIAIPRDSFGNPVEAGTPVTIHVRHPAPNRGSPPVDRLETVTRHLISWARIFSNTTAGEMLLAVSSGDAHSPERTVREVPGPPAAITLYADRNLLPADGRQLVRLYTDQIVDAYGNVMLDGTSVQFLADHDDGGRTVLTASTLDGRASTTLQAPKRPGRLTVRAVSAGGESAPISLTFLEGPAVNEIPVRVMFGDGTVEFVAGPLVGPLNQFVPDGTEVIFTIQGENPEPVVVSAPADFGYATGVLRVVGLRPGVYTVTARAGTGEGVTTVRIP